MPSFKEEQAVVEAEQRTLTPEEIKALMDKRSEATVDLNNLPQQTHHWVDRGLVMNCEGGSHGFHQVFKRR